jgi:lysozyme family protein
MINDQNFLKILPFTLIQECPFPNNWNNPRNFSNDAHDPGGETMCGIIQREYDVYRKGKGLPVQDVIHLTQEEGYDIYYNSYYLPECPKLPIGLALSFFDVAVNGGPSAATRLLQRTLNITTDGDWGSITEASVKAIADIRGIIISFTNQRTRWYKSLRGFQYFGTDWLRRTSEIGTESLKLTTGAMV